MAADTTVTDDSRARRDELDVLIVGGGPCGLAAAYAAARRGLSVEVVEASSCMGGMSASFRVAGQCVDYGSHRLHPAMPPRVRSLLDDLLGADLQTRPRNGRLRLHNRWVAFPLRPADLVANTSPAFAAASVGDLLIGPLRRRPTISYADVVHNGLGDAVLGEFHGPMAEKLWGVPVDRLDAELARKRISVSSPSKLAKTILRRPAGRTFLYPRLGYGQIVEALAGAAESFGARLTVDTTVRSLTPADRPVAGLSSGRSIRARRVLWTAPGSALAATVGRAEAVRAVPMRGLVLVYLVLPVDHYTEFDAHYVPDGDVAFSRLSEPRNYRDGPDPAGQTVLCAEIPASPGDHYWQAGADELTAAVTSGMARCDLPPMRVETVEVKRLPSVYPLLTIDDTGARDRALESVNAEGVTLLGRQGLAVPDNLHHVIDMALSAVDCVDDEGTWDCGAWMEHRRRFDGFVVED